MHFPLVPMNRLNQTKSAVFLYCRFSLFLKDLYFQIIYCKNYAESNYTLQDTTIKDPSMASMKQKLKAGL